MSVLLISVLHLSATQEALAYQATPAPQLMPACSTRPIQLQTLRKLTQQLILLQVLIQVLQETHQATLLQLLNVVLLKDTTAMGRLAAQTLTASMITVMFFQISAALSTTTD